MTASLTDAMRALERVFPGGFDGCVIFHIEDLGILTLDSQGVHLGARRADTILRADARTFAAILSGRKNPMQLYLKNGLKIEGDLKIAMQLARQL